MSQVPRLLYSLLGNRVYIVTRYREGPVTGPRARVIIASRKSDVTDDFKRAMREWKKHNR